MSAEAPPAAAPPAGPAAAVRWWRRRSVLVAAGVLVVVAVAVVTDLPHATSRAQQVSDESTVIGEINTDVSPCTYAARESFSIYGDLTHGTVTPSQRATIPGLLRDDVAACSFTDNSIFDLSNVEVPGSAAGRQVGQVVETVTVWATSDAVSAIEQIETLAGHPHDAAARRALSRAEGLLAADRSKALAEVQAAGRLLGGAHLPAPDLPVLPRA